MLNSKPQTLNSKQIQNSTNQKSKRFDLEERTFEFAKRCRNYVIKLPRNIPNIEYGKQLVRSSGSVSSNYIEANESLSKKDYIMRTKICRKEAKESRLWLKLAESTQENQQEQKELIQETIELTKIFGAILEKCK